MASLWNSDFEAICLNPTLEVLSMRSQFFPKYTHLIKELSAASPTIITLTFRPVAEAVSKVAKPAFPSSLCTKKYRATFAPQVPTLAPDLFVN